MVLACMCVCLVHAIADVLRACWKEDDVIFLCGYNLNLQLLC